MSFRVLTHGEALIDFIATDRGVRLRHASAFTRAPGGAPANVAVGLARLGVPSAFFGMVGEDEFGQCLRETLAENGVDVSALLHTPRASTTLAFVSVDPAGERSFAFCRKPGADLLLRESDVTPDLFDGVSAFHFGSLSMTDSPCREATLKAAAMAREKGLLVSYDPNLRLPLWPSPQAAADGMRRGFPFADILKIAEDECAFLFGKGDPAIWAEKAALSSSAKVVLVTRAGHGSVGWIDGQTIQSAGFPVAVSDTTGAGDAFVAGFLHFLSRRARPGLEGLFAPELRDALRQANACGALACTRPGAIPALPSWNELQEFLRRQF